METISHRQNGKHAMDSTWEQNLLTKSVAHPPILEIGSRRFWKIAIIATFAKGRHVFDALSNGVNDFLQDGATTKFSS